MKIEVFIMNQEYVPHTAQSERSYADHYCTSPGMFKTQRTLTEESQKTLEEAREKARELNAKIVIYDMSTFRGKLVATLKGIKSPTWKVTE